jgi:hypothetical protein
LPAVEQELDALGFARLLETLARAPCIVDGGFDGDALHLVPLAVDIQALINIAQTACGRVGLVLGGRRPSEPMPPPRPRLP